MKLRTLRIKNKLYSIVQKRFEGVGLDHPSFKLKQRIKMIITFKHGKEYALQDLFASQSFGNSAYSVLDLIKGDKE